jgi:colicin import membrane protein
MSAMVYQEPYRLPAGVLALLVHSLFFALLYFGLSWNRQAFLPPTISVELWSSLPEEVVALPVNPKIQEAIQPPQEKVVKPDIVIPEKKKVVAKPEKKPVPKPVEVVKPKPKTDIPKPVEQKPDTRISDQQAASARAEKIKQEEQAAATGRIVDEFKAKIMAKIRRNVVNPPSLINNARAEFMVTLLPGGAVLKAELKKSSGNEAYDKAVERAILKSDPLPLPPDVQLFNRFRELNLVFKPTE